MIYDSILEASSSDLISVSEAATLIGMVSEKKDPDFPAGEITMFGNKTKLKRISAYYNDGMTEADAKKYMSKLNSSIKSMEKSVLNYVKANIKDFADYDSTLTDVEDTSDLASHVKPDYVIASEDNVVLMCTCKWDTEHGIGIQFIPSVKVGPQDNFL